MEQNRTIWSATKSPEDIAGAIVYKLYSFDADTEKSRKIEKDLAEALAWIKACAGNPYNSDFWRTCYMVLEDLENSIEDEIPWWDKE